MITKGEILKIYSGQQEENKCKVRLPLFASAAGGNNVEMDAVLSIPPGVYNGYSEGDVVYVTFEDDVVTKPVVIGKLYLGSGKEKSISSSNTGSKDKIPKGSVECSEALIDKKVTLPEPSQVHISPSTSIEEGNPSGSPYETLAEFIEDFTKLKSAVNTVATAFGLSVEELANNK